MERTVTIDSLLLDDGTMLASVEQRVTIYGSPRDDGSNVVLVAHALTGSSRAAEWWPQIVGEGAFFDPREWCVVGINALGGCYGSTGPSNRRDFPRITVRDIVRAQQRALDELRIDRCALVVGGSLGGMQALQWALDAPGRIDRAIVIGAHDHHSAMGIALNAIQRECLALDPVRGLRTARKLAMLTYKSEELLAERHDRRPDRSGAARFDVEGYLDHQADVFESRMDAGTYATLTHAMDSFDARNAQPTKAVEARSAQRHDTVGPEITFIGMSSDWLFRPQDVRAAAERLASRGFRTRYAELQTPHGHDAFLAEPQALSQLLQELLSPPPQEMPARKARLPTMSP